MDLILNRIEYEKVRDVYRQNILLIKKNRCIIGPNYSIYFENIETIQYQIQEVLYLENSFDNSTDEIQAYQDLIPKEHEIVITFFIEIDNLEERTSLIKNAHTLLYDMYIRSADNTVLGCGYPIDHERLSCVNFIKFIPKIYCKEMYICSKNQYLNFCHKIPLNV